MKKLIAGLSAALLSLSMVITPAKAYPIWGGGGGAGGGSGTPGGTSGQIQYNNSGAFGGLDTVPVANGGTGASSLTSGSVLIGAGTSSPTGVAPVNGNCLLGSGGAWVSGACTGTSSGNLGSSVTAASPQRTGDATTGLYTAGATLVDLSSSGKQIMEWGPITTSTFSTGVAQGLPGTLLGVASTTGLSVGGIVSGDSHIPVNTQIGSIVAGTTSVTATASQAISSGKLYLPVASTTGFLAGQLIVDTTTSAAIFAGTTIAAVDTGTTTLSTTANGTSATGQKVLTVNSTTNVAVGYLLFDTTTNCIPADSTVSSFVAGTSITIVNNITGTPCLNGDTIVAYPALQLSGATQSPGVGSGDTLTAYPTVRLSQTTTTPGVGSGVTLTTTSNATSTTNYGAFKANSGASFNGDLLIGQGIKYAGGNLISVPPLDNTSLAIGTGALSSMTTAGSTSVAIGNGALKNQTSSNGNTAVGYNALLTNVTGIQNTAMGYTALFSNTGANNAAFGYKALQANTTGNQNTAVGDDALLNTTVGIQNTAVGNKALYTMTGGTGQQSANNAAFGFNTLQQLTTGNNNTALGTDVGSTTLTTGANNILIGTSHSGAAGSDVVTGSDSFKINIGNLLFWSDKSIAAPTVSACGTNSIDAKANNATGTVNITAGTPASCTITFAGTTPYATWNHCVVSSQSVNANFAYSYTTTAITLTGTGLAGQFDYSCQGY